MKISTLQSLIDRTSNQIAEYEASVELCKMAFSICTNELENEQNLFEMRYYKAKLPKLREIQKDLKKEIADKVRLSATLQRGRKILSSMKHKNIIHSESLNYIENLRKEMIQLEMDKNDAYDAGFADGEKYQENLKDSLNLSQDLSIEK